MLTWMESVVIAFSIPAVHLIIAVYSVLHILRSRKRLAATILWIIIVVQIPWFGPIIYLIFGINSMQRRIERRQDKLALLAPKTRELPGRGLGDRGEERHSTFEKGCPEAFTEFFELLDNLTGLGAIEGNRCTLLRGGEAVFSEMERAIDEAQSSIHLMTYILDYDEVGRSLIEHLRRKAKGGVRVRVLVDGYGSSMIFGLLRKQEGMDVRLLRQFQPLRGRVSVNLRNHRKLLICDGRVAFTGGMNISARHLLEADQKKPAIDYHTRIDGPLALQLQRVFAEDWFDVTSESILDDECFPQVDSAGDATVRTVNSGPDKAEQVMLDVFCAAIQTAGSSIKIVTPYFVPDPAVLMLLKLAAMGGVETTLILPRANNHPWIKYASRYRYPELLEAGVRIYEREAPFSHSKLFLVDEKWACVGSANWDMRTFHLQFDTNVGVVSESFVAQVSAAIDDELAASREVELDSFLPRPLFRGIAERAMNLFEDLL